MKRLRDWLTCFVPAVPWLITAVLIVAVLMILVSALRPKAHAQMGGVQQPIFVNSAALDASCGAYDSAIISWENRVIYTNGGAAPSTATKDALNCFWKGCIADGLDTNLLEVCCFVPDNLIASITPLKTTYGSLMWTNVAFDATNLSVAGLKGDGSSKYLKTTFNPTTVHIGDWSIGNFSGISLYVVGVETNLTDCIDIGAANWTVDSSADHYIVPYNSTGFGAPVTVNAQSGWHGPSGVLTNSGFYSGNRVDNNNSRLFVGTAYRSLAQLGMTDTTSGSVLGGYAWTEGIYVFAINDFQGGAGQQPLKFSARTISFAAIHRPLSVTQVDQLYNRVQTLRSSLGGGYVAQATGGSTNYLVASYDMSGLGLNDGDAITSVPDLSSSGYDLSSSGAGAPYWTNNAGVINNQGWAQFDGSNDSLTNLFTVQYPQPTHMFIVANMVGNPTKTAAMFSSTTTTNFQLVWEYDNNTLAAIYAGTQVTGPAFVDNWYVWEVIFDGGVSVLKTNNVTMATGAAGTAKLANIALGGNATNSTSWPYLGGIANAKIYTNYLSMSMASNVVYELGQKYGITTYTRN